MNYLNYIPKRAHAAIHEIFHDEDGYWVRLKEGWHVEYYFAERTIHEDTLAEVKEVAKRIRKDKRKKAIQAP